MTLLLTAEVLSFMHDSDTRLHSPYRGRGLRGADCLPLLPSLGSPGAPVLESQHEGYSWPFCCSKEGAAAAPGCPLSPGDPRSAVAV